MCKTGTNRDYEFSLFRRSLISWLILVNCKIQLPGGITESYINSLGNKSNLDSAISNGLNSGGNSTFWATMTVSYGLVNCRRKNVSNIVSCIVFKKKVVFPTFLLILLLIKIDIINHVSSRLEICSYIDQLNHIYPHQQ